VKKSVLSILYFLAFISISAQESRFEISQLGVFSNEDYSQSKIYLNLNPQLNEIVISKTLTMREREIWSVKIYQGSGKNSRAIANSNISSFKTRYGDVEAKLLYASPFFKVLVGNFKTRIEAESFRRKVLNDYPGSRVESIINSKE